MAGKDYSLRTVRLGMISIPLTVPQHNALLSTNSRYLATRRIFIRTSQRSLVRSSFSALELFTVRSRSRITLKYVHQKWHGKNTRWLTFWKVPVDVSSPSSVRFYLFKLGYFVDQIFVGFFHAEEHHFQIWKTGRASFLSSSNIVSARPSGYEDE